MIVLGLQNCASNTLAIVANPWLLPAPIVVPHTRQEAADDEGKSRRCITGGIRKAGAGSQKLEAENKTGSLNDAVRVLREARHLMATHKNLRRDGPRGLLEGSRPPRRSVRAELPHMAPTSGGA